MQEPKRNTKKDNRLLEYTKRHLTRKIIVSLLIVLALAAVVIGLRKTILSESKTTKIGFEDIGELATQSAYCTQVSVTDSSRKLFGAKIPFTQSKYIFSYDVIIKAGFDFGEIEWSENGTSIEVRLPEAKILSNEIDLESFKVYHEEESIYNQITLEDNNEAMAELKQKAEQDAIDSGLLDNARSNAEIILKGFFGNVYDLDEYAIVFKDK